MAITAVEVRSIATKPLAATSPTGVVWAGQVTVLGVAVHASCGVS